MALTEKLTTVADAIRCKTGGTEPLTLDQMAAEIAKIETGDQNELLLALSSGAVTEVCSEKITSIRSPFLYYQTQLTRVDLPNCKSACAMAFYGCTSLQEVNLPQMQSCKNNVFRNCSELQSIVLPGHSGRIDTSAFEGCSKLEKADFMEIVVSPGISQYAFGSCKALTALIIRNTENVPGVYNEKAFDNTPIADGTGYIYVPSAMIERYKAATIWSAFGDQFRAIEDYPEITGG